MNCILELNNACCTKNELNPVFVLDAENEKPLLDEENVRSVYLKMLNYIEKGIWTSRMKENSEKNIACAIFAETRLICPQEEYVVAVWKNSRKMARNMGVVIDIGKRTTK